MSKTRKPVPILNIIKDGTRKLKSAGLHYGHGTETARDEAAWLMGHVAGLTPAELEAHLNDTPTRAQLEKIHALIETRIATRKPLAYLLKEAWFADLKFYVDEHALVPRSLTC